MHIHIADCREFLKALSAVKVRKTTLPVLQYAHIIADSQGVQVIATDLEVWLNYRLSNTQVLEYGQALVPMQLVLKFIKALKTKSIELQVIEQSDSYIEGHTFGLLKINGESLEHTMSTAEFPQDISSQWPIVVQHSVAGSDLTVWNNVLSGCVDDTGFFSDLFGVWVNTTNEVLATNKYFGKFYHTSIQSPDTAYMLPYPLLAYIPLLGTGCVSITVYDCAVKLQSDKVTLICRNPSGWRFSASPVFGVDLTVPRLDRIYDNPEDLQVWFTVDRNKLQSIIAKGLTLKTNRLDTVILAFTRVQDTLTVYAHTAEKAFDPVVLSTDGTCHVHLPDFTVYLNAEYILEIIKGMQDSIVITLAGEHKGVRFFDQCQRGIVMSMSVRKK